LPNEQLNSVAIESENLKRQLEQERAVNAEHVNALKEELRMREEEMMLRYQTDQNTIRELIEKNQKLEKINVETSKDYFALRLKMNDTEKRLHEENELLRLKNAALGNKLKILTKKSDTETKVTKDLAEKKAEEYTNKYRTQIKQKEENLFIIKDQYAQVQQIYINRVKDLEDNLSRLTEKYTTLEKRRLLDLEGFKADIRNLVKKVKNVEQGKGAPRSRTALEKEEEDEDDEELTEDAESIASEELDIIKKQLAGLERKLDRSKKFE